MNQDALRIIDRISGNGRARAVFKIGGKIIDMPADGVLYERRVTLWRDHFVGVYDDCAMLRDIVADLEAA